MLNQVRAIPGACGIVFDSSTRNDLSDGLRHHLALRELEKRKLIQLVEVDVTERPGRRMKVIVLPWL